MQKLILFNNLLSLNNEQGFPSLDQESQYTLAQQKNIYDKRSQKVKDGKDQ